MSSIPAESVSPLVSAEIQDLPSAIPSECTRPIPTSETIPAPAEVADIPPVNAEQPILHPIAPLPIWREGKTPSQPASPITPRLSARARKPSAKVAEMAELNHAGPSGTSGMAAEAKEEQKPLPRFLQPDHFSNLNNGAKPPCSGRSRWEPQYDDDELSPEDDPMALRGIPIFKPTMEEFQDFEGYINKTAPWGMRSGICKIIPPTEWTQTLPPMSSRTLSEVHIKSPIQQNMMGTAGIFRAQNIEKNKTRPLSVKEWFTKCQDEKFVGPSPKILERDSREAMAARLEAAKVKKEKWAKKKEEKLKRRAERLRVDGLGIGADEVEKKEDVEEEDVDMGGVEGEGEGEVEGEGVPPLDAPSSGSSHSSPEPPKTPEEDAEPVLDEWYQTTDFTTAWLPKNTTREDYTLEACVKLQEKYWKSMGLGEPSWYGADLMQGSLFADVKTPWNVAHLPNLLDRINCVVPGVNEPYLYFGMWRATFAWHVEDMDLFSINYIHFGAPKFWYAIPQVQADHFERFLATEFPLDARECDQFIRHKSIAISPTRLKDAQTRVNMLVHNQGEFVITYPRGYHAGFNMGFNCAESVNFATDDWVDYGRKAKHCKCVNFSVRIDVDTMLAEAADVVQQDREGVLGKRNREDGGEDEIPGIIPGSVTKTPRKRVKKPKPPIEITSLDIPPTNEMEPEAIAIDIDPSSTSQSISSKQTPSKSKKQAKPPKPVKERPIYQCLFCPSSSTIDLCPVYEPDDFIKSQWKGVVGETIVAHLNCAQSTPECYFHEEIIEGIEKIWIMGANDVNRDRWNKLKCKLCLDKNRAASGVKVQCTKGKCPAAFHYSCAKADEHLKTELWQVEEWLPIPLPPDAPEGAQPELEKVSNVKLELLCPTHNPAQKELKEREKAEELRQRILTFHPGQMIKIKQGSGCFEYRLIAIDEDRKEVEVQIHAATNMRIPWARVDLRGPVVPKLVVNDYARHHVTSRKSDNQVPVANAPMASLSVVSAPAPTTFAASTSAPPHMIHPPPHPLAARQDPSTLQARVPSQDRSSYNPVHHDSRQSMAAPTREDKPYKPRQVAPTPVQRPPQPSHQPPPHIHHPLQAPRTGQQEGPPQGWPPADRQIAHYGQPMPQYAYNNGYTSAGSYPAPVNAGQYPPGYALVYHAPRDMTPHAYGPPSHPYYPPQYAPQHYTTPPPPHQMTAYPSHDARYHFGPAYGYQHPPPHRHMPPAPPASLDPRVHAHLYGGPIRTTANTPRQQSSGAPSGMQHLLNPNPPPTESNSRRGSSSQQTPAPASSSSSSGIGKIDLGLDRMQQLMATVKPLTTPAIHIAGTNGKGSVSAMIESTFLAAGFRTARYNSPHLIHPRDAIRMNGKPVNAGAYGRAIAHFQDVSNRLMINATTFEIATAAAYALISEYNPDIMIIECGMGGLRDATNVIPPHLVLATVLTPVGLDHTAFLGETIEAITSEKSSIAVKDALFIIARQPRLPIGDAVPVAYETAKRIGAEAYDAYNSAEIRDPRKRQPDISYGKFITPSPRSGYFVIEGMEGLSKKEEQSSTIEIMIPLPGLHQLSNASTAITILNHLRAQPRALHIQPKLSSLNLGLIKTGIERTKWAGRCSWLNYTNNQPILVDGAHNSDSATSLRRYIETCLPEQKGSVTFVVSLSDSKGKTPESVLHPLLRKGDKVAIVEFSLPVEGMPWIKPVTKEVIMDIAGEVVGDGNVWCEPTGLTGALEWGMDQGGLVVVCGSLYLVADVYRLLGLESEI